VCRRKAFMMPGAVSRKLPRSTTCSFRVAHCEIGNVAEYSKTSPARRGNSVSGEAGTCKLRIGGQGLRRRTSMPASRQQAFSPGARHGNRAARRYYSGAGVARTCIQIKKALRRQHTAPPTHPHPHGFSACKNKQSLRLHALCGTTP